MSLSRCLLVRFVLMLMVGGGTLFAQIPLSVPKLSASQGSDLKIPLNLGDLTGRNVTSFEFIVSCDTNIIRLTGVDQNGTLSSGLTMFANNRVHPFGPGTMKVVCASARPLSGKGVLVYLTGKVQKTSGSCALQLSGFIFNTGDPIAQITNGSVNAISPQSLKRATTRDTVRHGK